MITRIRKFSSLLVIVPLFIALFLFLFRNVTFNVEWLNSMISNVDNLLDLIKSNLNINQVNIYMSMAVDFMVLMIPSTLTYFVLLMFELLYDLPNKI